MTEYFATFKQKKMLACQSLLNEFISVWPYANSLNIKEIITIIGSYCWPKIYNTFDRAFFFGPKDQGKLDPVQKFTIPPFALFDSTSVLVGSPIVDLPRLNGKLSQIRNFNVATGIERRVGSRHHDGSLQSIAVGEEKESGCRRCFVSDGHGVISVYSAKGTPDIIAMGCLLTSVAVSDEGTAGQNIRQILTMDWLTQSIISLEIERRRLVMFGSNPNWYQGNVMKLVWNFSEPQDLAFESKLNRIWVSDTGNKQLQVFKIETQHHKEDFKMVKCKHKKKPTNQDCCRSLKRAKAKEQQKVISFQFKIQLPFHPDAITLDEFWDVIYVYDPVRKMIHTYELSGGRKIGFFFPFGISNAAVSDQDTDERINLFKGCYEGKDPQFQSQRVSMKVLNQQLLILDRQRKLSVFR